MPHLAQIALIVRDYDEALAFYTATPSRPRRSATSPAAGSVLAIAPQWLRASLLFLATDDFARDYAAYRAAGVKFVREPVTHDYGTVAVFEDLYGNRWDLVEFAAARTSPAQAP